MHICAVERYKGTVPELSLALFPGSCVGGEKRAWYTPFAHAQFFQDFWEFGNSRKICSITLTSARHADFSRIKECLSQTTLSADDDKGATKVLSPSLARVVHMSSIPAKAVAHE